MLCLCNEHVDLALTGLVLGLSVVAGGSCLGHKSDDLADRRRMSLFVAPRMHTVDSTSTRESESPRDADFNATVTL